MSDFLNSWNRLVTGKHEKCYGKKRHTRERIDFTRSQSVQSYNLLFQVLKKSEQTDCDALVKKLQSILVTEFSSSIQVTVFISHINQAFNQSIGHCNRWGHSSCERSGVGKNFYDILGKRTLKDLGPWQIIQRNLRQKCMHQVASF